MYQLDEKKDASRLEELRSQCPDRQLLELRVEILSKPIVVYAKPPSKAIYKRFRAKSKQNVSDATEEFLCACVIHPDGTAMQALIERYPGLIETFTVPLFEACGQAQDAEVKNF